MTTSRYFQPEIETAERSWLGELQRARLAERIAYTLAHSPFTQALWDKAGLRVGDVATLEDFTERAPMFVQSDVSAWADANRDPFGGLMCMDLGAVRRIDATSGTTGVPVALPQYDGNPREVATCRDFAEDQVEPGGTVVRMVPIVRNGYAKPVTDLLGLRAVWLDHGRASIPALVEASLRFRPGALHLLGRPLVAGLQAYEREHDIDLAGVFASYRATAFGGEPLSVADRALFARWGIVPRVQTSCGNTIAAVECLEADGCHTWEDLVLIEVLDPVTGRAVPEGAIGEMVVTTLVERATPLLRFRTEDLVRYTSARCGCGRTHGRIWTIGRTGDSVRVQGVVVLPQRVVPILEAFPETAGGLFQIVAPAPECDVLRVRVGCSVPLPQPDLADAIAAAIIEQLGVPATIELVSDEAIVATGPGYKIKRVVSA